MNSIVKPIFLLADSQLLFYNDTNLIDRIKKCLQGGVAENKVKAAYIGASNGDDPRFYEIFKAAFKQIDINNCRLIKSYPDPDDTLYLSSSNIILLAGGDTKLGWHTIKRNGWDKILIQKYYEGVILVGISAGAIQIGLAVSSDRNKEEHDSPHYLQLIDYIVDVHSDDQWQDLKKDVISSGHGAKGVGIPHGAGLVYLPDGSLESIRFACIEFINDNGSVSMCPLAPLKNDNLICNILD